MTQHTLINLQQKTKQYVPFSCCPLVSLQAGADLFPPEIYKEDGNRLVRRVTRRFHIIWDCEAASQDFKNALIVHNIQKM